MLEQLDVQFTAGVQGHVQVIGAVTGCWRGLPNVMVVVVNFELMFFCQGDAGCHQGRVPFEAMQLLLLAALDNATEVAFARTPIDQ